MNDATFFIVTVLIFFVLGSFSGVGIERELHNSNTDDIVTCKVAGGEMYAPISLHGALGKPVCIGANK